MPIFKKKNKDFFKKWSSQMAYVLGFFCADGCMFRNPRGGHYIAFYSNDRSIIENIRNVLDCEHRISKCPIRRGATRESYALQIGSREMFDDLKNLGIMENKSKILSLPNIPNLYFSDFVRGYFDGDGSIVCGYFKKSDRNSKSPALLTRFISGSEEFLEGLQERLSVVLGTRGSLLYSGGAHRLAYSTNASRKLFEFIYKGHLDNLYLERKYKIFLKDKTIASEFL